MLAEQSLAKRAAIAPQSAPFPDHAQALRQSYRNHRALWLFCAILAAIVLIIWAAVKTLSSVRAYVEGESLWAKARHDAIALLYQHMRTPDPEIYREFRIALRRTVLAKEFRDALDNRTFNRQKAMADFLEFGLHPDEFDGVIWLYRVFRHEPHFNRVVVYWAEADAIVAELDKLSARINEQLRQTPRDPQREAQLLAEVNRLDALLVSLNKRFSATLGEAARFTQSAILVVVPTLTALLLAVVFISSRRNQAALSRLNNELITLASDLERRIEERTKELAATRDDAVRSHAELKRLVQQVTVVIEDERRSIAREIHDRLNADVVVVRLAAQRIQKLAESPADADKAVIPDLARSIVETTNVVYQRGRSIVRLLRPETLDSLGLFGAVQEAVDHYNVLSSDCHFTLEAIGDLPSFSDESALAAYRIVQEALSNIHKHAQASTALVRLEYMPTPIPCLEIQIHDDGKGFDMTSARYGIGLIGMRERAHAIKGRFAVTSSPGHGCLVEVGLLAPQDNSPTFDNG